jgi:hypothetical protein
VISQLIKIKLMTPGKKTQPITEDPVPDKKPELVPPDDPDNPVLPSELPDIIPEEDPFENPPPYEIPEPGERP